MPKKNEQKEVYQYRQQIADAVSWELTYQIMRRYQARHSLRIYETHPGGGQYDCISIYSKYPNSHEHFFDFNLQAQSLHVWRKGHEHFKVVDDYLHTEDPKKYLDKICRQAGLTIPRSIPPSNGPIIACGVMAGLLHLKMFSRKHYKYYMGYCDSSGFGGVMEKLLMMFNVTRIAYEKYHRKDNQKFYRYFFLEETLSKSTLCLFDMSGKIILRDDSEIDLKSAYDKHQRNITSLSSYVLSLLPD